MHTTINPETLTFARFDLVFAESRDLYNIGAEPGGRGVLPEMADAFGYNLAPEPNEANLRGFVGVVGQAKTLQDNIAAVQERLGTDADAVNLARGWLMRTGFLDPVSRSYVHPDVDLPPAPFKGVMTGGVANWMDWRAQQVIAHHKRTEYAPEVLLAAGTRPMRTTENDKVTQGMSEADYMEKVIQPRLGKKGIRTELIPPGTNEGDEVMDAAASALQKAHYRGALVMFSNGGAWVQNGGQMRRALHRAELDAYLYVVSESKVELGTGVEPTRTHQNPFSALGQVVRNGLELHRNMAL